jgi:hypothetical protein
MMLDLKEGLGYAAEAVKIAGGIASFYAVVKLRQIEKKYLFNATVPALIVKIDDALSMLNLALSKPSDYQTQTNEALNLLLVDVKNVRRKARGDSLVACAELLSTIRATRSKRSPWQTAAPIVVEKGALLDIYGKGRGLIRSLENDMRDHGWSGK